MSDAVSPITLENISALSLAGGMESRQQNQDRQSARGSSSAGGADSVKLSPEGERQLQKLRERDREVRAHEQAHIAAGGEHVSGGASYSYQTGPDGRQYAIGGSVHIDVSPVPGNPEATAEKARVVHSAALAPANPSAADQNVAAKAAAMESKARTEQTAQAGDAGPDAETESTGAAAASGGTEGMRSGAAAYERFASPVYGASWQSSAGGGNRPAIVYPNQPWPSRERAAAVYAAARDSVLPQKALAPWGTGISLAV